MILALSLACRLDFIKSRKNYSQNFHILQPSIAGNGFNPLVKCMAPHVPFNYARLEMSLSREHRTHRRRKLSIFSLCVLRVIFFRFYQNFSEECTLFRRQWIFGRHFGDFSVVCEWLAQKSFEYTFRHKIDSLNLNIMHRKSDFARAKDRYFVSTNETIVVLEFVTIPLMPFQWNGCDCQMVFWLDDVMLCSQ